MAGLYLGLAGFSGRSIAFKVALALLPFGHKSECFDENEAGCLWVRRNGNKSCV